MPNIIVKIPAATLDATARAALIEAIHTAAMRAEQMPDDPKKRMLCWVVVEEVEAGFWACGGADMSSVLLPVWVQVYLPLGVLDDEARAQYVAAVHQAISRALPNEKRHIASSCIINDVAEGTWGVNGMIWSLPDFAKYAGYVHLQK